MIVSIENKANEEKMQASSSGATISTNPLKSGAGTLGMNYGVTNSYNQYLNEAYIRGVVDFKKSEVRNKGCLVMDIENAGASYQYIPGDEVHETNNFAIGLSGLNLRSPDAFVYSLGRSLASSATSAGVGILASEIKIPALKTE